MRAIIVVIAGMVLAGGAAMSMDGSTAPALPAAGESKLDPPFILSFWCAPAADKNIAESYKKIAECGFNLVFPVNGHIVNDSGPNKLILDTCQATGLKAVIGDPRLRKVLTLKPDDPDFKKNLDSVVADYSAHPALAAYMIEDEPHATAFPQLEAICKYLREKDPKHFAYINLFPSYGVNGKYEDYISSFIKSIKPAIVSWDNYCNFQAGIRAEYFSDLEDMCRICTKSIVPYLQIILVSTPQGFSEPNEAELRFQVYTTLCYGAHGLMYFTYAPCVPRSILEPDGKPGAKYQIVRGINARIMALAPTLIKLKSAGVYHTEPLPRSTSKLAAEAPVKKMDGGTMVLGWLKDAAGDDYIFVVNRSCKDKIKAQLTLDAAIKNVEEISQDTGKPQAVPLTIATQLTADLEAGEGKLFRLRRTK